ncbi:hypothetical protein IGI04_042216 [Brassica rapa subsp. trilocularis]|uniref:Uncharacterized protein n=1 Tax=Brassica rapa subsp. trilocularis TaxID=1813537 RepID=A0ABQ7KLM9_BRACM|nr:hypothetical protein IGI04_042216 [Brassica rapa subsp. trilocularis]
MKVFGISQEGDKAMCIVRDSGTDRRSVPSTVRPLHTPKSSGSAQIKMCNVRASQVAQTPGEDFRNKHKLQLTPVQLSSLSPQAPAFEEVHKESDTCNSPTAKNVETKVLCHCISSLGHSKDYRKCSMGHYAMRSVSCESLYGDSNTLLLLVSVLSLRGSLNAYDPWSVTSLCKGSYKGSSAGVILGSLRVKLMNPFCLSKKLVMPWRWCNGRVGTHLNKREVQVLEPHQRRTWSFPSFSKKAVKSVERGRSKPEAVKSVERGRPQTSSMKR